MKFEGVIPLQSWCFSPVPLSSAQFFAVVWHRTRSDRGWDASISLIIIRHASIQFWMFYQCWNDHSLGPFLTRFYWHNMKFERVIPLQSWCFSPVPLSAAQFFAVVWHRTRSDWGGVASISLMIIEHSSIQFGMFYPCWNEHSLGPFLTEF